jgi:hypothetical protein
MAAFITQLSAKSSVFYFCLLFLKASQTLVCGWDNQLHNLDFIQA